jgi:hypothetical protein
MNLDKLPFVKPYNKTNTLSKQTCSFIPKGPKFFAAFTYLDNMPVCVFIDNNNKQTIKYACFKEELCLGTLFYGTYIHNYFVCETIYYYKNEKVIDQLPLIKYILENMIRESDYAESVSFKLPHMSNSNFILECSNIPYTVYGILQNSRLLTINYILGGFQIKKRAETEDVYELFVLNELSVPVFYSTALVNDFKTSNFLNKLFCKKTNYKNIEFSDSEEESDCKPESKSEIVSNIFVGCLFIPEFKKWKPYGIKNIDFIKTIQFIEKKNIMI